MGRDAVCRACGFSLDPGDRFCGACGHPVAARPPADVPSPPPIEVPLQSPIAPGPIPDSPPAAPDEQTVALRSSRALRMAAVGIGLVVVVAGASYMLFGWYLNLRGVPAGSSQVQAPAAVAPGPPPASSIDSATGRSLAASSSEPAAPAGTAQPMSQGVPPPGPLDHAEGAYPFTPPAVPPGSAADALRLSPPASTRTPAFDESRRGREQFAEGLRYYYGQGVAIDYTRAAQVFAQAARAEGRAAYYLAVMHARGQGVALDRRTAFGWLLHGASLGDAQCEFTIGMLYLRGDPGVIGPDPEQAARWLRAAAAKGQAEAAATLRTLGR
jgi:hypothetical protein